MQDCAAEADGSRRDRLDAELYREGDRAGRAHVDHRRGAARS